jgi:SAM-dependent methyltransferase
MSGADQASWHSQDAFWEMVEPVIFNPQRLASAPADVEKIIRLLQIEKHARILDLCCGIGRHTLEFAHHGFEIVGVDRTRRFIERARQEAAQDQPSATFLVGDMRDYCAPASYDVVVNLFGSFGYFEDAADDRKVVENAYASLRPGGKFLIETAGKEILARTFQEKEWSEEGDLLLLAERKVTQNWGRIQTRWIAIRGTERLEHQVSVHSYSAAELSTLFSECGFPAVRVYGNLEGADYDQAAKRLVVVGRK